VSNFLSAFPAPFLEDIVSGRCLPFIGAGFSLNAKLPPGKQLPDWDGLGKMAAQSLPDYPYINALDTLSAYEHTFTRKKLVEFLNQALLLEDIQPAATHAAFCRLPFPQVVTTNFDLLLEQAYAQLPKYCLPQVSEALLTAGNSNAGVRLLKLHGDLHHPDRLVVTENDYAGFLRKFPLLATHFSALLIDHSLLFIGYSADDPDFQQLRSYVNTALGDFSQPAYVLQVDANKQVVERYERRGVKVINLPREPDLSYAETLELVFRELLDYWQKQLNPAQDTRHSYTIVSSPAANAGTDRRQAELIWLENLQDKLQTPYTPLAGESRQTRKKLRSIPSTLIQHAQLEHLSKVASKDQPEQRKEYTDIQTAFALIPRAVLLGEPGAGKSTSLHKLAGLCLSKALADPVEPIPLFIPLGDWREPQQHFASFLAQKVGGLAPHLPELLQSRRCVLLLDGLNEPPSAERAQKAGQLKHWLTQTPQNKVSCYVSCRDLDYTLDLQLGLDSIRIRPLEPLSIRDFIRDYWPLLTGNPDQAAADQLFWELGGGEELRQTWLAWQRADANEHQFWSSEDIPRENPNVYSKTTAKQDNIWKQAVHSQHSLMKLAANPFMLSMLIVVYISCEELPKNRAALFALFVDRLLAREDLSARQAELQAGLKRLAWAMQQLAASSERTVQTTLARQQALAYADEPLLQQAARANLLDAGDDVRFSHQLLQEYFTASMMQEQLELKLLAAESLWPGGEFWKPSGWEEATLLLAGLPGVSSGKFARWLAPVNPELLARCALKLENPGEPAVINALQQHWRDDAWLDTSRWPQPEARAGIARAFGLLQLDRRSGVGLNDQGWPDIAWAAIPAGEVVLEDKAGSFPVAAFHLARYPVTHSQFQSFIDDPDGYTDPRWWKGLAATPTTPETPYWSIANHPRETVSWYEAMAFCAWLTDKLGYAVTLPTEWQWQQAACSGRADFNYPWGADYQSGYANIDETVGNRGPHYLQRTTAVGIYPQGDSRQGVSDLSGNVWEWCLNGYYDPANIQIAGTFSRVLRGGSWISLNVSARASYRFNFAPVNRNYDIGFRVCCVSPI
jgi:formylglycine-generating enzyme required for sulfatase activity